MKFSTIFSVNALVWIGVGIMFTIYAPLMVAFLGIPEIPSEDPLLYWNVVSFARLFGAALFGLGLLMWSIRGVLGAQTSPETRRGILFALLLTHAGGLFVSITQAAGVWQTAFGWVLIALFGLFFIADIWALAIQKNSEASIPNT